MDPRLVRESSSLLRNIISDRYHDSLYKYRVAVREFACVTAKYSILCHAQYAL